MSKGILFLFVLLSKIATMRIVGEIAHPILKITVFSLNMKYAIKLEAGLMEQTFKIRESDAVKSLKDIERIVDETFLNEALERFKVMNVSLNDTFKRNF
jgi:hypothetical protein